MVSKCGSWNSRTAAAIAIDADGARKRRYLKAAARKTAARLAEPVSSGLVYYSR
jgi:hypothetical protein